MKNRILSIVLAVLTVMSVIPFTFLSASAELVQYASFNATRFPNNFEDSPAGYVLANTEFDGQTVKKITIDPSTDPTDFNPMMYCYDCKSLRDESTGVIPKIVNDGKMYYLIEYYYDTTGRDATDEGGKGLDDGRSMHWTQGGVVDDTNNSNKVWAGVGSSSDDTIVANEWATQLLVVDLSNHIGKYIQQVKFYPFGGKQTTRMYRGDVLYLGNITIASFDPTDEASYPTDKATVKFYESQDAYTSALLPVLTENPTYVTKYVFPEYPADQLPEGATFIKWVDVSDGAEFMPGDTLLINRRATEEFYAVLNAPVDVEFYVDEDTTLTEKWKTNTTVTIPAAPQAPEGYVFVGWLDVENDVIYQPGEVYSFGDYAYFEAKFSEPQTITFNYGDGQSFTEKWAEGETVYFPSAPADYTPEEGQTFFGWVDADGTLYKAYEPLKFDGSVTSFTAKYGVYPTVYVSASAMEGVDESIRFTAILDADAYIASNGGIGTIKINGTAAFPKNYNTHLASEVLTIEGCDETSLVEFNGSSRIYGENSSLTFRNIIVGAADREYDEDYVAFSAIDVTFEDTCKFKQASKLGDASKKWNLYIGAFGGYASGTYGAQYLTFSSPDMRVSQMAPITGYAGGGYNMTQDTYYTINAGTMGSIFGISRNGNGDGKKSTLNGNTTIYVNGGNIDTLGLSHMPSDMNGTMHYVINGGTISKFYGGVQQGNKAGDSSNVTNLIIEVNAKQILDNGGTVPKVQYSYKTNITGVGLSILNNAELVDGDVDADYVSWLTPYRVAVYGGSADYTIIGDQAYFTFTPDNADETDVYVNGVLTEADENGYFTFEQGATLRKIEFADPGAVQYTVSYSDGLGKTVSDGKHFSGKDYFVKNMGFTNGDMVFDGYLYDGKTYRVGDKITMPDADVEFVAQWKVRELQYIFVASDGSDSNDGSTLDKAMATVDAAITKLGSEDGCIIVTDRVMWPTVSINSDITVTGKDPRTGDVYETASIQRTTANGRPSISGTGKFTLSYIEDYNTGTANNHPIQPTLPEFTLGEGYRFATSNNANNTAEVSGASASTDITFNFAGALRFFDLYNWSTRTYEGNVTVNVLPTGKFYDNIRIGGDTNSTPNSSWLVVKGTVFVNVKDNQNAVKIRIGGYKAGSNNTFNGIQVLSVNSNNTITHNEAGKNVYNNGEYFINVPEALPAGADVISNKLGKLTLAIPEGYEVMRTDDNGTETITESGEISLAKGETQLVFVVAGSVVNVNFDDGSDSETTFNGAIYTVPNRDVKDGKALLGWYYGDAFYPVGANLSVPTDVDTIDLMGLWVNTPVTVYLDAANGSDTATGIEESAPVRTMARVSDLVKNLTVDEVIVKVIGEYKEDQIKLPAISGKLILDGGENGYLSFGNDLSIESDIEFRSIGVNSYTQYKQLAGNGHNITFGDGFRNVEGSYPLTLHSGKGNSDMTGDQTIIVNSGRVGIQAGPYYVSNGQTKTWTGNLKLIVNGGTTSLSFGDGYKGVEGNLKMVGNINVIHNGGKITQISQGYLTGGFDGETVVVSKPVSGLSDINMSTFKATVIRLNGVDATVDGKTVTLNEDAYVADGANYKAGDTVSFTESGVYTFRKGASIESGLTFDGAQIRLTDPQALRFVARLNDATEKAYAGCEYGIAVIPTKVLGKSAINIGATYNYGGKDYTAAVVPAVKLYDEKAGEYKRYTAAMTGFTADTYNTDYTAVAYIKVGDNYIYGQEFTTSIYKIAKAALEDESVTDKTYFESIVAAVEAE